jgi:hypothetical protein
LGKGKLKRVDRDEPLNDPVPKPPPERERLTDTEAEAGATVAAGLSVLLGMSAAPDLAEPIEAWRVWRVIRADRRLLLASVIHETLWQPLEPLRAACLRRTLRTTLRLGRQHAHESPKPGCSCGVYAAGLDFVRHYLLDPLPSQWGDPRVLGRVALWGTVVECEHGYRASLAYPTQIYLPTRSRLPNGLSWDEIADNLGRYQVPIEALNTRYAQVTTTIASTRHE